MSIFNILAKPLGYVMTWLYGMVGNYGISLIIFTVVIKLILYPFYKKQILSTSGMSDIQPKMRAIQNRYANDPTTMNEKMRELYKEEGVSPTAGCLPMVVQMIILMGMFALLGRPLSFISSEKMVFAIHESFLWIQDLSQPDPWILPILSGVATFASFYMSSENGAMPGGAAGAGNNAMMNIMKYGFPIMVIWLAKTYAAGLAIYWFISQFIQIFYNIRFNQIRRKMAKEKAEAKKKKRRPVRAGQGVVK